MIRPSSVSQRALYIGLLSLVLSSTGCTLSEQANCQSDADCEANQICLSSGGVFVRDAVCVDNNTGNDADLPNLDAEQADADIPDSLDLDGDLDTSDAELNTSDADTDIVFNDTDTNTDTGTDTGLSCQDEEELCEDQCVQTNIDENNCGDCGSICAGEQDCVGGECVDPPCDPDQLPFGGGDGTIQEPYLICSAEQLNQLGASDNHLADHFELYTDIDLSTLTDSFAMIGTDDDDGGFEGVFDGKDHSIFNLSLSNATNYTGLFRVVEEGGEIRNIHLEDITVEGAGRVGGLVGLLYGRVSDITVSGSVSGESYVGGLIGATIGSSLIQNSQSSAEVMGEQYTGGLVGRNTGVLEGSSASGDVSAPLRSGGLVGQNGTDWAANTGPCEIIDSHSTGAIIGESVFTGTSYSLGGLVGRQIEDCSIIDSTATGNVIGPTTGSIGGLVGASRSDTRIINSHAEGDVTGQDLVGGLVGKLGSTDNQWTESEIPIQNCSAQGAISGRSVVGGLVGLGEGSIAQSFATGSVEGENFVGGLVGRQSRTESDVIPQITASYTSGDITGDYQIGGLVGEARGVIENSYALGNIVADVISGGLVGQLVDGTLTHSFHYGFIDSGTQSGALVGYLSGSFLLFSTYWNKDTTGINTDDGGAPLTPDEFTEPDHFLEWDFDQVWTLDSGVHPELLWQ